jgi:hypothetical protein
VISSLLGKRVPDALIHGNLERRRAEALVVGALDLILGQLLDLERRDDLPRDQRAVDRAG